MQKVHEKGMKNAENAFFAYHVKLIFVFAKQAAVREVFSPFTRKDEIKF